MLSSGASGEYAGYVGFTTPLRSFDTLDLPGSGEPAFWAEADSASLTFNVSVATRETTTGAAGPALAAVEPALLRRALIYPRSGF